MINNKNSFKNRKRLWLWRFEKGMSFKCVKKTPFSFAHGTILNLMSPNSYLMLLLPAFFLCSQDNYALGQEYKFPCCQTQNLSEKNEETFISCLHCRIMLKEWAWDSSFSLGLYFPLLVKVCNIFSLCFKATFRRSNQPKNQECCLCTLGKHLVFSCAEHIVFIVWRNHQGNLS